MRFSRCLKVYALEQTAYSDVLCQRPFVVVFVVVGQENIEWLNFRYNFVLVQGPICFYSGDLLIFNMPSISHFLFFTFTLYPPNSVANLLNIL